MLRIFYQPQKYLGEIIFDPPPKENGGNKFEKRLVTLIGQGKQDLI